MALAMLWITAALSLVCPRSLSHPSLPAVLKKIEEEKSRGTKPDELRDKILKMLEPAFGKKDSEVRQSSLVLPS